MNTLRYQQISLSKPSRHNPSPVSSVARKSRIAFYGGTFDPVHCGHLTVAKRLVELFGLDRFIFVPAFHAPHKPETKPTSAFHRFAMLCLATAGDVNISVSDIELETGEKQYSIDTLSRLKAANNDSEIFFVMGADSWSEITTWRDWERLLLLTNQIVVSRPGYEIESDHITEKVRERIVDLRGGKHIGDCQFETSIYITDAVWLDVSATAIREDVREDEVLDRADDVPPEVAKYIEKYELYR
jgi:nicotinate-nucleotide adenylyltransferase